MQSSPAAWDCLRQLDPGHARKEDDGRSMVHRRAVGATLASVILFGSLVVCNFALVAAQQQRTQLAALSAEENSLASDGRAAIALSELLVLDSVQSGLSRSVIDCASFYSAIAGILRGATSTATTGEVSANSTGTLAPDGVAFDNMTLLNPFAGSVPGALDLFVWTVATGGTPGLVSYQKEEAHRLFMPVDAYEADSYCLRAESTVESALAALGSNMCNGTAVMGTMQALRSDLTAMAARLGLGFLLTYSFTASPQCSVGFTIQVSQSGVEGPLGPFSWSLSTAGTVSP